jgi:hypothetical protein
MPSIARGPSEVTSDMMRINADLRIQKENSPEVNDGHFSVRPCSSWISFVPMRVIRGSTEWFWPQLKNLHPTICAAARFGHGG